VIPIHGYLEGSGTTWRCDRGYAKTGTSCVALDVPANAHLNNSGEGWECNRPYRRQANQCVL